MSKPKKAAVPSDLGTVFTEHFRAHVEVVAKSGVTLASSVADAGRAIIAVLERGDRLVDDRLNLTRVGDIAQGPLDGEASSTQVGDGWRQPLFATRAQHECCAGFGQAFRHFLAETPGAARDDRDPTGQIE